MASRFKEPIPKSSVLKNMRYDRAIVIGGSITGILSAVVLAQKFREVIIIEKDSLSDETPSRRGVSQAEHPHVLLAKGYRLLEELLPGIGRSFENAGAIEIDWATDYYIYYGGYGWNARSKYPSQIKSFSCSRLLLEQCIREKIYHIKNIKFITDSKVTGLKVNQSLGLVVGVNIHCDRKLESSLDSDIVVDASGKRTDVCNWLSRHEWQVPNEIKVEPYLGYSTCRFRIPDSKDIPWKVLTYPHVAPKYNRKAYLAKIENNQLIATIGVYARDYPPVRMEDFFQFAKNLQDDEFFKVISVCEPVSKVYPYRGTANRIREFDKIEMPSGLIVLGDAYCSLCPSYGQGMTCSALGAEVLFHWLENQSDGVNASTTSRFQFLLSKKIVPQWNIAVQQDLGFPATSSTDASLIATTQRMARFPLSYINIYIDRLIAATTVDHRLNYLFVEVINIIKSPVSFFSFKTVLLVLISMRKRKAIKIHS